MFGVGGFHNLFHDIPRPFIQTYRCYSISMFPGHDRQEVENGGKIFLPPTALEHLTRLNVVYPMLFKLTNVGDNRSTHCGVLEFVADEGKMYIPYWMMRNLMVDEGASIQVESATLPVASFSKFEPQSVEFLDITNPKAMLENALRNFACLTTGDMIAIRYNDRIYELRVLETKPGEAVSIIECDMDVEFAKPIDYVEPEPKKPEKENEENQEPEETPEGVFDDSFIPFLGCGHRLDGKSVPSTSGTAVQQGTYRRGVPDYDFRIGQLTFARNIKFNSNNGDAKNGKGFKPFGGSGTALKSKSSSSTSK